MQQAMAGQESEVQVEWRPFELRPAPQPTLRPEGEYLQRAWTESVYPLAREMGVTIHLPPVSPQPHTHLAFEGYQFARQQQLGNAYNSRLLRAFFQEGLDIGQVAVLADLAGQVGLDQHAFREALETRRYREAHQQALQAAQRAGVTAVPTFVIGPHYLPGVQSVSILQRAIADAKDHPEGF